MTRKEYTIVDIEFILEVTAKMAALLACVIVQKCAAASQQPANVLSSPITEASVSPETWQRIAFQYTIIFSSRAA
jgi:hypothetical protein